MSTVTDRSPFDSIKRRLYLLAFVDEFGPVYAVYTLWFNDNGVSTAEISTAFLLWAVVALVLEIPSGALADRVDRRPLLAAAFGVRAVGLSVWLLWPTFTGLVVGTALWAIHDALASGAWEAMIHDQLAAVGHADAYAGVMARISQSSHLGVAAGTLLGAGLLRFDTPLDALGWITVVAHAGSISLVLLLPDARRTDTPHVPVAATRTIGSGPIADAVLDDVERDEPTSLGEWWSTLRAGVVEASRTPVLAKLVVIGALLEGLYLLDEYVPLLARARGGDDAAAPVIVFVVWIGLLIGGEVAARAPAMTGGRLGSGVVIAVAVTTVAFVTGSAWTLMLIGVAYGALETALIISDARLQERTSQANRATVASVRGFGGAAISMAAFAVIGVMADGDDPTPGHFVVLAALVVTGLLVARWLPPHRTRAQMVA